MCVYVWGLVWIDSVCELAREQRKNRRTTESLYKQTGCVGSWTLIFILVGISRERTLEPSSIQSHFCSTMSHKSTQAAFQEIKEKKALYKQRWVEGNSITHTSVANPFLSVCRFYISGFVLNSQAQNVYGVKKSNPCMYYIILQTQRFLPSLNMHTSHQNQCRKCSYFNFST